MENNHYDKKKERKDAKVTRFLNKIGGDFEGSPRLLHKLMRKYKTFENKMRKYSKKLGNERLSWPDYNLAKLNSQNSHARHYNILSRVVPPKFEIV